MAGVSEVSICNQALGWVGGTLITAFTDQSNEAKLCQANYETLRDAVLESVDWTFATARFIPARLATPPPPPPLPPDYVASFVPVPIWGYANAFQIPVQPLIMRVIYVGRSPRIEEDDPCDEWAREQDRILCNDERIYCRGIQRIVDPLQFSHLFTQALAARLAMDLAIPIANSRTLQADMSKMYGAKLMEAAAQDGKQGRSRRLKSRELLTMRRAGTVGSFIGPEV